MRTAKGDPVEPESPFLRQHALLRTGRTHIVWYGWYGG